MSVLKTISGENIFVPFHMIEMQVLFSYMRRQDYFRFGIPPCPFYQALKVCQALWFSSSYENRCLLMYSNVLSIRILYLRCQRIPCIITACYPRVLYKYHFKKID